MCGLGKMNIQIRERPVVPMRIQNLAPIRIARFVQFVPFALPLAIDAHGSVGEGLQACQPDGAVAVFTFPVLAGLNSFQRNLDIAEFAGGHLDQLGADFAEGGIAREINDVATTLLLHLLEEAVVTGQGVLEGFAALFQDDFDFGKGLFSGHVHYSWLRVFRTRR